MNGGCPYALSSTNFHHHSGILIEYPYPGTGAIDRARIRIVGTASPSGTAQSVAAGIQYTLFGLDVEPQLNGCTGCETPMALKLLSVRINQPEGGTYGCAVPAGPGAAPATLTTTAVVGRDVLLAASSSWDSSTVFFNGVPSGYSVTGVGHGPRPKAYWLAAPEPNPSVGTFRIRYGLARDGDATLGVFDVAGRSIRTLVRGNLPAGEFSATWDGRGEDGSTAPGGVYFLRLRTPSGDLSRTIIRVH